MTKEEKLGVGGWRAHRVVTVKEVTRSSGRPAFESIADITLELGSWVDGNFIVFGLSFHGAAAALYSEIKATGKLPPREMLDVFHAHVAKTMNGHTVESVEVPFVAAVHDPDPGEVLDGQEVERRPARLRHPADRVRIRRPTGGAG